MSDIPQSLKNHGRLDPPFHIFTFGLYLANVVFAVITEIRRPDWLSAWYLVVSLLVIVPILKIRIYPLKVQDRVIRLEERLRLQALAPAEWHAQIYKLNEDQLIGLRFAGDDEVVELAKQAVEHGWSRQQIKERIKSWRPDDWRV
ncbi:MAG TPA: DUF6526 family protein [Terracidiphilus sp.]|jgi:hypothetical protein|nr:DUF6526 family protein [Terracidiphilus sp.]